tara:strand:- start:678 stop:941 length:264 start_codon:yes stop_codon:yes gene_type:complete
MEAVVEESLVALIMLIIRKAKLEKKVKKKVRCILRKCVACLGYLPIQEEIESLNRAIDELKKTKINNAPLTLKDEPLRNKFVRSSSI